MAYNNPKLNIAVIGVGNLGQHHARIYTTMTEFVNSVYVVDIDKSKLDRISKSYNVITSSNYKEILDKVDAVSLVVPTQLHYQIGKEILLSKKHLLIEKPITTNIDEAEELISIAKKSNLILQVGHVERFNPVVGAVKQYINNPKFIESMRLGPFDPRVADVGVVLDLMIHDIDIVLSLVNSKLKDVESYGAKVFTKNEDIVKARLRFNNECICDLTASRISFGKYRMMRIFQQDSYISIDFMRQKCKIYRKTKSVVVSPSQIDIIKPKIVKDEPLKLELLHFVESVIKNRQPTITAEHARDALNIALDILIKLRLK